jgi:16S rRNA (guanine966-N2)-methyltransferase
VVSLRVIAGAFRGRRLLAPPGLETRPMPDRVKQALFDWIGPLDGAEVADVCAGSGTVGCEALSRGARLVHLVEPGRHAQSILAANARALGSPAALRLHARPFQSVLPGLRGIDLLIADPPFPWYAGDAALIHELLALARACLAPEGRIYLRGERGAELATPPAGLRQAERRLYGRSWIAGYVAGGSPAGSVAPGVPGVTEPRRDRHHPRPATGT